MEFLLLGIMVLIVIFTAIIYILVSIINDDTITGINKAFWLVLIYSTGLIGFIIFLVVKNKNVLK